MGTAAPDDLSLALALADAADALTVAGFARTDLVVDTKPDRTWVTEVDRAVEDALRERIGRERPDDAVLGEERGSTGSGARRWIIDPIDGTSNFVRRVPVWATLIALEDDGALVVGVVSAPALGRRWWAGRGLGAFAAAPGATPQPISVSAVARLDEAHLSTAGTADWEAHGGPSRLAELSSQCWRERAFGDFWSHVLVAEGACDIGIDPIVSLWDLAALQVVVEEAGGRFTDFAGVATPDGGSAISTNGLLHDQVLGIIGSMEDR